MLVWRSPLRSFSSEGDGEIEGDDDVIVFVGCVEIGGDGVYFVLGRIAREEPVDAGCGGFSLVIAAEAAREECSGCEQETAHHENGEGAAHRILRHENPPLFAAG